LPRYRDGGERRYVRIGHMIEAARVLQPRPRLVGASPRPFLTAQTFDVASVFRRHDPRRESRIVICFSDVAYELRQIEDRIIDCLRVKPPGEVLSIIGG
jgi:hypothetical protein